MNFRVYRGDTFQVQLAVVTEPSDTPVDLTGATLALTVTVDDDVFVYTEGSGLSMDDPMTGLVNVFVEDTDTEQWGCDGHYKFEVTLPGPPAVKRKWFRGIFLVS